jgi:TolA-binding protein
MPDRRSLRERILDDNPTLLVIWFVLSGFAAGFAADRVMRDVMAEVAKVDPVEKVEARVRSDSDKAKEQIQELEAKALALKNEILKLQNQNWNLEIELQLQRRDQGKQYERLQQQIQQIQPIQEIVVRGTQKEAGGFEETIQRSPLRSQEATRICTREVSQRHFNLSGNPYWTQELVQVDCSDGLGRIANYSSTAKLP